MRAFGSLPTGARLYYGLFNNAFAREQRAVLAGELKFEADVRSESGSSYQLRRNIHRIEKALTHRSREEVFALDFIDETVLAYQRQSASRCSGPDAMAPPELLWAGDVLAHYFDLVTAHPSLERARAAFETVRQPSGGKLLPFIRETSGAPPVSSEQLLALAQKRRSCRWFTPEPVDRALVDRALEAAIQSPSACNRQPYHFRILEKRTDIDSVAVLPGGAGGYYNNIPMLIVVVGTLSAYFAERDRHIPYIDASLATMTLLLGLETVGLASCCINWPDIPESDARAAQLLDLQPYERVIMLVAVGHPDPAAAVPRSVKRAVHATRTFG